MTTARSNHGLRWLQFSNDEEYEPAPDILPSGMAISAVPVVIVLIVSMYLRLGNVQTFLVAAIRCVAQLMVLGSILYPIFVNNSWYVVLPYIFLMITFATREASVKPKHRYKGMRLHMLLSLTMGVTISFSILTGLVLRPSPWWDASVMIPVCGMLMGSSVNALSLGMDRLLLSLSDSDRGSARLQTFLSCRATRWEASLPSIREAIETGLTPNLNQMSIMGLVSIPGMMAGQILGGTSPFVAAKYQIVIMFFICSNSTMVLFGVIVQAVHRALFDKHHRFLSEAVSNRKGGKPKDIALTVICFICDKIGLSTRKLDAFDIGDTVRSGSTKRAMGETKTSTNRIGDTARADAGEGEYEIKKGTFRSSARSSSETCNLGSQAPQEALCLTNGEIKYESVLHLSSLSVILRESEILVLKGPSGCGKSSLLRGLALFEPFQDGTDLKVNGQTVAEMGGAARWRSEVCYIRQQGGQGLRGTPFALLADLCALHSQRRRISKENPTDDAEESKAGGKSQRLADVEKTVQKNIESLCLPPEILNRPWEELSGGESQRVYLCVLLSLRPSVCLVDEPTSALDENNSLLVEKLLLGSGVTLIWVTHDPGQMERLQSHSKTTVMEYHDFRNGAGGDLLDGM